jgi:hypothetical protein
LVEYQRTNFSANINKYHMLSSKKLVDDTGEKAFSGYDVKFSGQAPYLPWAMPKLIVVRRLSLLLCLLLEAMPP